MNKIHFYNERGVSLLTEEHLVGRIKELEVENVKLKSLLRQATKRLANSGNSEKDISGHSVH